METRIIGKITGMSFNAGTLPDGKKFDVTKLYVESELKGNNSIGTASQPFNWGKADNSNRLRNLQFPVTAEIVMEIQTNGKGESSMIVVDVLPVDKKTGEIPNKK